MITNRPIYIGISQCLTNSTVRYDAKNKYNEALINKLSRYFELLAICPEVEAGLSVPRPPVELVKSEHGIKVKGRDDKTLDITDKLVNYSAKKVTTLTTLSGFVFKSYSPSCGLGNTPVYHLNTEVQAYDNGIFVQALLQQYPEMPVADDESLNNDTSIDAFVRAVIDWSEYTIQQGT